MAKDGLTGKRSVFVKGERATLSVTPQAGYEFVGGSKEMGQPQYTFQIKAR